MLTEKSPSRNESRRCLRQFLVQFKGLSLTTVSLASLMDFEILWLLRSSIPREQGL